MGSESGAEWRGGSSMIAVSTIAGGGVARRLAIRALAMAGVLVVGCGSGDPSSRDAGVMAMQEAGLQDGASGGGVDAQRPPDPDAGTQPPPIATSIAVRLVPEMPAGSTRVSFAVPFPRGALADAAQLSVRDAGGTGIAVHLSSFARHADGSVRSVLVQFEAVVDAETSITVEIHPAPLPMASTLAAMPVEATLDANGLPRVWAVLPASWLSDSGFAGPLVPSETLAASDPMSAWARFCDYARFADTTSTGNDTWLYDRGTVYVRAYAQTGALENLRPAYRAVELYRSRITGTDSATRIGLGSAGDPKYHYTQNLALMFLLTGDARFQSASEDVAVRMHDLHRPTYDGRDQFWTERSQGFALIAYTAAMSIAASDEERTRLRSWADAVVDASLEIQRTYPVGYTDADARCFAHDCEAHDPDECEMHDTHYFGCSPWMSAILAEGLDNYAWEVSGERAASVHRSLGQLARIMARDASVPGTDGRPYYWMGVGPGAGAGWDEGFEEHRGEVAYMVALGAARDGDDSLRASAGELVRGLSDHGELPHVRSFNWQCRAAVMTPALLR